MLPPAPSLRPTEQRPGKFRTRVVFPVYNEAEHLQLGLPTLGNFAAEHAHMEFLFVDDGSSDATGEVLEEFASSSGLPNVRVLRMECNRGKGAAVREGVLAGPVNGIDYLIFSDGDFAYPFELLDRVELALAESPVVIGSRRLAESDARRTSLRRTILGQGFNFLTRRLFGFAYRDTQAGIKGFQASAARKVFRRLRVMSFAFDVELLAIASSLGLKVAEVPVRVNEGHSYKSGKIKLARDSLLMLIELFIIRHHLLHEAPSGSDL